MEDCSQLSLHESEMDLNPIGVPLKISPYLKVIVRSVEADR